MDNNEPQTSCLTTRLEGWRKARGMSQAELAEKIGISRQSLSSAENGHSCLSLCSAFRAARALSCNIDDIYSDSAFDGRPIVFYPLNENADHLKIKIRK